jgi:hypothetical protein
VIWDPKVAIGRDLVAGILKKLKSHPALAALIVGGMGLVGLGEVIGALNQLLDFADSRLLRYEESQPHSGKLEIVFCRLPQSRRPFITISKNCNDRGGEALVFEPANFAVALGWWAPLAEEGDPEAQTYIGELYEQGLAGSPDYATAAKWYQRAAEQGHATAQVRLALLYERGLGLQKDSMKAAELFLEVEKISYRWRSAELCEL